MKVFREREWVVVPGGRCGQVRKVHLASQRALVQFGADGPFEDHFFSTMRWATKEERDEKQGITPLTNRIGDNETIS